MRISEILGLDRKEIWPVYRELAFIRSEYRDAWRRRHECGTHYLFPTTTRRSGRPRDIALGVFVSRLRRAYIVCTKKNPTCWSGANGRFHGDFFVLCNRVAFGRHQSLVAKESLSGKGKAISRILISIHRRAVAAGRGTVRHSQAEGRPYRGTLPYKSRIPLTDYITLAKARVASDPLRDWIRGPELWKQ